MTITITKLAYKPIHCNELKNCDLQKIYLDIKDDMSYSGYCNGLRPTSWFAQIKAKSQATLKDYDYDSGCGYEIRDAALENAQPRVAAKAG